MRKQGFTLIELLVVVAIIGLLAAIAIPVFTRFQLGAKEARVKGNCRTLALAAEDFTVVNEGVYASDTDTDQTSTGQTIRDLMPGGVLLESPFTNAASEPRSSGAAAGPGETGYVPIVGVAGTNDGYQITGFGQTATVLTLSNGN